MKEIKNLLAAAVRASVLAGYEVNKVYAEPVTVEKKEDDSPLTLADKNSHQKISEKLSATSVPILSEEGEHMDYDTRKGWNYLWIIDPLDGTKEFIKRNGEFTINIALIRGQVPILGVIYVPVPDILYFGAENYGSFKISGASAIVDSNSDDALMISTMISKATKIPAHTNNRSFTVVASRSHMSAETEGFINDLRKEKKEITLVSKGSSLKICLVAEGAADVYPRFAPTMEWDTAAGQAIAEQAGFKMIDAKTKSRVLYNKQDLHNPWFIVTAQ